MDRSSLLLKGRHAAFAAPADLDVKIWRYMDFTQFVNMLEEKGLLFIRTDLLDDKFEGTMSRPLHDSLDAKSPWVTQAQAGVLQLNKGWSFVNCWHMNEFESPAMWKIYSTSKDSVCVQTTFARLRDVLPEDIYLGVVNYISYDMDMIPDGNGLWPLTHKRRSFEHERELRALWSDIKNMDCKGPPSDAYPDDYHPAHDEHVWKHVDLSVLIEKVFVSPTAKPWFLELLKKVLGRYGLNVIPVRQSDLAAGPLY
jgi:hypothetical protein